MIKLCFRHDAVTVKAWQIDAIGLLARWKASPATGTAGFLNVAGPRLAARCRKSAVSASWQFRQARFAAAAGDETAGATGSSFLANCVGQAKITTRPLLLPSEQWARNSAGQARSESKDGPDSRHPRE